MDFLYEDDCLYIGDIPKEFHYASFNEFYVDLFNTDNIDTNGEYPFYRVYLYDNCFFYTIHALHTSEYTIEPPHDIKVSSNIVYRRDFDSILFITFIFILLGVWLLNLITSCVRKGGVLGGLL